jgi:hypothetical protein
MCAQIDPRMLLQAAMNSQPGAAVGAPAGALGGPAGTTPAMGAPTDALPSGSAAAAPTGAQTGQPAGTGGLSNVDLAQMVGSGTELSQDPGAIQQMVQLLQDPGTPPDQRAAIQMRLQLAALRSIAGGPSGATGTPTG